MTGTPGDEVRIAREGAILIVTIDRPHARNAVDQATAQGIARGLDLLDKDPELVVGILTGAGGQFCAGMDLKAFLRGERSEIAGRGFGGLTEAPPKKPLIAAVEGYALAGGCEMVLACDMVVAAENATFGIPEVARGLVAGAGGLLRLPQRIPPNVAFEYALTGAHMTASDARQYGLVNRLTPPSGALDGARELAASIARNGPLAVQMSKRILVESAGWSEAEKWERLRELVEPVIASDDAREGAAAFTEKRAPKWTGK